MGKQIKLPNIDFVKVGNTLVESGKTAGAFVKNHATEFLAGALAGVTIDISVTLWIVGNHKKSKKVKREGQEIVLRDRENEILFIDARTLGDGGANEDGYVQLTEADKQKIASTLFAWQSPDWKNLYHDVPEFCYSATMEEIRSKDWSLVPSEYIEFVDRDLGIDFQAEMNRIQQEMKAIMAEEHHSQEVLRAAFEGIGYGIE